MARAKITHGKSGNSRKGIRPDPIYKIWTSIGERTKNPNHPAFARYGGRGIRRCARWENSFEAFASDMGPRPAGYYIDRIDNDKGYSPENCRWVTPTDSTRNRRNALWVEVDGKNIHIKEACERFGVVSYGTAKARIRAGWPRMKAVRTAPGLGRAGHSP